MTPYEKLERTMNCYGFGSKPVDYWVKLLHEADNDEKDRAGLYPETVEALRAALREYFFGDEDIDIG